MFFPDKSRHSHCLLTDGLSIAHKWDLREMNIWRKMLHNGPNILCHHLILPCLSTVSFTGIMSSYPALFIYSQFHWDYVIILTCPVYPLFTVSLGLCHYLILPSLSTVSFTRIMLSSYPALFIYSQFHSDDVIMLYCLSTVS